MAYFVILIARKKLQFHYCIQPEVKNIKYKLGRNNIAYHILGPLSERYQGNIKTICPAISFFVP